ncbi:MAG TPA: NAD(P)H-dependent oxidoreductase [Bacteriovoracaceae bacterium]|nr:NAD(P)H-dependent oxidoreductase [Bacteriovoracaceae bacterium]
MKGKEDAFLEALNWRYATKRFDSSKKIPQDKLNFLLETLRLAPSSFGLQPWYFVVVENPTLKEKLYPVSWGNRQVLECSHLLVLCAPSSFGARDIDRYLEQYKYLAPEISQLNLAGYEKMMKEFINGMNPSELDQWMFHQVHIALGFLLSAAAAVRVDSCPMGGFQAKEYDRILGLTERNLQAVVLCALGYRSDEDNYAERPKVRFS